MLHGRTTIPAPRRSPRERPRRSAIADDDAARPQRGEYPIDQGLIVDDMFEGRVADHVAPLAVELAEARPCRHVQQPGLDSGVAPAQQQDCSSFITTAGLLSEFDARLSSTTLSGACPLDRSTD